ncbi:hypothetical protein [Clostridium sp. YIM B02551]|uniref:hypothetical protein n=1 Tax=Clostridium sp. YIM B02551 TaxID=2910679 RepID=UPI001EEC877D|nr:hypothetical protein [Clostridium sp. YIM B02551]
MINLERVKGQVLKAISIKPTHISLMRNEVDSNGMRGGKKRADLVAKIDVFIDDSNHSNVGGNNKITGEGKEAGSIYSVKNISMLIVAEGFEVKVGDYFELNGLRYEVTYPGLIMGNIYESDLEVTN